MTWRPESGGKFRANVAFKVDSRFPAQVSVVGEAVDIGGGGGGNKGRGDARKGRKRAKGQSVGGGDRGKRRSLSQEAALRGAGPYASVRVRAAPLCSVSFWRMRLGSLHKYAALLQAQSRGCSLFAPPSSLAQYACTLFGRSCAERTHCR